MGKLIHSLLNGPDSFGKSFCSCAPSPPPAPDYAGAAQQQGQANIDAARVQSRMNNPNVYTPYGNQTVTWYGDTPYIVQTLSPAQQTLLNKSNYAKGQLSDLAIQGANNAKGILGSSVDFSGAPQVSSTDFSANAPAMPGSASDTRQKVYNAMMSRVNEDQANATENQRAKLLAAGIPAGSKAYDDSMNLLNRQYNDAQQQAILNAGQEAQRDYGMDLSSRQQAEQEAQQQFNATTANRNRALAEMMTQRQTPINEISALMSGSQVSNPFSMPGYAQNTQVQAAPIFAAQNALANYNTDVYNAKAAQAGNLQSGLFGLAGAGTMAYGMSDRRLKSNIVKVGRHSIGVDLYRSEEHTSELQSPLNLVC